MCRGSPVSQRSVPVKCAWGIIQDIPLIHEAGEGRVSLSTPRQYGYRSMFVQSTKRFFIITITHEIKVCWIFLRRNFFTFFKRPVFDMCAGVAVESSGMMGQTRGMEKHRFRSCEIAQWRTIIPIEMLTPERSATRTTSPRTGFRSSTSQVPTAWRC